MTEVPAVSPEDSLDSVQEVMFAKGVLCAAGAE